MISQPPHSSPGAVPALDTAAGTPGRALAVCDLWLGSNGYAGMKALRRAGWSVHVVAEWEYVPIRWEGAAMKAIGRLTRPAAVREFNDALVGWAEKLRPELLMVFKGMFVRRETLQELRRRAIRTYCFYPDVSFRAHGPYLPSALPEYDWVFTTKTFGLEDMRAQLGISRASVLLHAFDPDLHGPRALSASDRGRYACDVSFIGTWSPKKERLLATLVERRPGIRVRVWGEQWFKARTPVLRSSIVGYGIEGEEYVRAINASTINLGILSERRRGASSGDRITSRTFHIPACDAFLLHERTDEVTQIFPEGSAIGCFADADELVVTVDEYLAHADRRRAMARHAYDIVRAAHSWDHRMEAILERHRLAVRSGTAPPSPALSLP